jgi:hypothetical protein
VDEKVCDALDHAVADFAKMYTPAAWQQHDTKSSISRLWLSLYSMEYYATDSFVLCRLAFIGIYSCNIILYYSFFPLTTAWNKSMKECIILFYWKELSSTIVRSSGTVTSTITCTAMKYGT